MKQLEKIKEHWEIRFKDIDPDTGDTIADTPIAITRSENYGEWIVQALSKINLEPNREFYIFKLNEIKL
jgi:hypothetical protein